jgi:hypothetical protein
MENPKNGEDDSDVSSEPPTDEDDNEDADGYDPGSVEEETPSQTAEPDIR